MKIYSRSEWGARYRDGVGSRTVGSLEKYLHHSVTTQLPQTATLAQEIAEMRKIEAIGQSRFGTGMSYTTVFFPSGNIFEGVSLHRVSSHSGSGRNTRGAGLCFAGNYELYQPTDKQIYSLREYLSYGVDVGWWRNQFITEAHRQFKATACPGKFLYARLPQINRVEQLPNPDPEPTPAPPPVSYEWPGSQLRVDGNLGGITIRAWQRLLKGIRMYSGLIDGSWGPLTSEAMQQWLRRLGFYRGVVDGKFGPVSVRALQSFLKNKDLYTGLIDGGRGPMTVRAEQNYLNDQRKYF